MGKYFLKKFIEKITEKNASNCLPIQKKFVYLQPQLGNGALAHLARALDWQSKGDEFESRMLHKNHKKHWAMQKFLSFV